MLSINSDSFLYILYMKYINTVTAKKVDVSLMLSSTNMIVLNEKSSGLMVAICVIYYYSTDVYGKLKM